MKKTYTDKRERIHHNHQVFEYSVVGDKVLIRSSDGHASHYDKKQIKGESRPNLLKRLLRLGRRNVRITASDIKKFIVKHY